MVFILESSILLHFQSLTRLISSAKRKNKGAMTRAYQLSGFVMAILFWHLPLCFWLTLPGFNTIRVLGVEMLALSGGTCVSCRRSSPLHNSIFTPLSFHPSSNTWPPCFWGHLVCGLLSWDDYRKKAQAELLTTMPQETYAPLLCQWWECKVLYCSSSSVRYYCGRCSNSHQIVQGLPCISQSLLQLREGHVTRFDQWSEWKFHMPCLVRGN